jgi:hypothetical protein
MPDAEPVNWQRHYDDTMEMVTYTSPEFPGALVVFDRGYYVPLVGDKPEDMTIEPFQSFTAVEDYLRAVLPEGEENNGCDQSSR